jgi:hypothetical protein
MMIGIFVCCILKVGFVMSPLLNTRWVRGNPRRVGIFGGRVQGANGGQRELVTSNLGLRWTIPVTAGGCQVSKEGIGKGNSQQGECAMYSHIL